MLRQAFSWKGETIFFPLLCTAFSRSRKSDYSSTSFAPSAAAAADSANQTLCPNLPFVVHEKEKEKNPRTFFSRKKANSLISSGTKLIVRPEKPSLLHFLLRLLAIKAKC